MSMTLAQVNALSDAQFATAFESLLEDADWVIDALAQARPFADIDAFKKGVVDTLSAAPKDQIKPVILTHPKLGVVKAASEFSGQEQQAAGLGELTDEERAELLRMNLAYESCMGIPFIVAVKGMSRQDILQRLRDRLANGPEAEFRAAVNELAKIVGYRIDSLVSG